MPLPVHISSDAVDLSQRFQRSVTVAGSPAGASETTVCTLTVTQDLGIAQGIQLFGWLAFTVGTSGTASTVRIRQTNTSGTVIANSGALTTAAASLFAPTVLGFDTAPVMPNQVYVLTLTVTAGAATSTVSAVELLAIAI